MQLFLETSSLIRGLVEDNAHRRSASCSSLFRDFVLYILFDYGFHSKVIANSRMINQCM